MIVKSDFKTFINADLSQSFQNEHQSIFFREKSAAFIDNMLVPCNAVTSLSKSYIYNKRGDYINPNLLNWNANGINSGNEIKKGRYICFEDSDSKILFKTSAGNITREDRTVSGNTDKAIYIRIGSTVINNGNAFWKDSFYCRTFQTADGKSVFVGVGDTQSVSNSSNYKFFAVTSDNERTQALIETDGSNISFVTITANKIIINVGNQSLVMTDGKFSGNGTASTPNGLCALLSATTPLYKSVYAIITKSSLLSDYYEKYTDKDENTHYYLNTQKVNNDIDRISSGQFTYSDDVFFNATFIAFRTHYVFDKNGSPLFERITSSNFISGGFSVYIVKSVNPKSIYDVAKALTVEPVNVSPKYTYYSHPEPGLDENVYLEVPYKINSNIAFSENSIIYDRNFDNNGLPSNYTHTTELVFNENDVIIDPYDFYLYLTEERNAINSLGDFGNGISGNDYVSERPLFSVKETEVENFLVTTFDTNLYTSNLFNVCLLISNKYSSFIADIENGSYNSLDQKKKYLNADYLKSNYLYQQKELAKSVQHKLSDNVNSFVPAVIFSLGYIQSTTISTSMLYYKGTSVVSNNGKLGGTIINAGDKASSVRFGYFNIIRDRANNFVGITASETENGDSVLLCPIYDKEPLISYVQTSDRSTDGKELYIKYGEQEISIWISHFKADFKMWFYSNDIAVTNVLTKRNAWHLKKDKTFLMHNGYLGVSYEDAANEIKKTYVFPSIPNTVSFAEKLTNEFDNTDSDVYYVGSAVNPFPYSNTSLEVSSVLYPYRQQDNKVKTLAKNVAVFSTKNIISKSEDLSVEYNEIMNDTGEYSIFTDSQYPVNPIVVTPLYSKQSYNAPFVATNEYYNYTLLLDTRNIEISVFGNPFTALSGYDYTFSIRGSMYSVKDGRMYVSSNSDLSAASYVMDVGGLDFIGNTLEYAFFWSKDTGGLYMFDGSVSLTYFTEFISVDTPKSWYRTSTRDVIIQRQRDVLCLNDHYFWYDRDFGVIQDVTDKGILVEATASKVDLYNYDINNEHLMLKPIEIKTSYIGNGFNTLSTFKNVYFYGYAPTDGTNGRQWYLDIGGYAFVDNKEVSVFGYNSTAKKPYCIRYRSSPQARTFSNSDFSLLNTIQISEENGVAESGQVYFIVRLPTKTASMIRFEIKTSLRITNIAVEYDEIGLQIQKK